jgi:hypothetical protein
MDNDDTLQIFIPSAILFDDKVKYEYEVLWRNGDISFCSQIDDKGRKLYYYVIISDCEIPNPDAHLHMGATE